MTGTVMPGRSGRHPRILGCRGRRCPGIWDGRRGRGGARSAYVRATGGEPPDGGGTIMATQTFDDPTNDRRARPSRGDPGADPAPGLGLHGGQAPLRRQRARPLRSPRRLAGHARRPGGPHRLDPPRRAHQRRRHGGARLARAGGRDLPQRPGRRRLPDRARPGRPASVPDVLGPDQLSRRGARSPRPSPRARPGRSSSSTTELQEVASAGIEAILAGPAAALPTTVDFSRHRRVLDVGGGTGSWSIAVARAYPHLEATVFELPTVADVARKRIAAAGLAVPHRGRGRRRDDRSAPAGLRRLPAGQPHALLVARRESRPAAAGPRARPSPAHRSCWPTSGPIRRTPSRSRPR